MCWSADAWTASSVQATAWTDATIDSALGSILGESDASMVCSAIRLQTAPGVRVVVDTTTHAHVSVEGAPARELELLDCARHPVPVGGRGHHPQGLRRHQRPGFDFLIRERVPNLRDRVTRPRRLRPGPGRRGTGSGGPECRTLVVPW